MRNVKTKEKEKETTKTNFLILFFFVFRLNYASIVFLIVLSIFIETSNAQQRVCIYRF